MTIDASTTCLPEQHAAANAAGRRSLRASVIIATYNHAAFIAEAIDSALSQSRVPHEIIVVDDGSTDNTSEILAQYREPVRVIRQENRGRSAARNAGLQAARGDLIVFLDSDDMLAPNSIEHRARIFERSPHVDVVYGDMQLIDDRGNSLGMHREYMPGPRPSGHILADLAQRCFILMPAMIRRSALGDNRFDESLDRCEDYDLWRRLAARGHFEYVDEPVAYYRLHGANSITSESRKMLEGELAIQRRFFAMAEFQNRSRRERARAYCYHGTKCAMLGRMGAARGYLARALLNWPFSPTNWAMFLLSLLGSRALSWVVMRRRRANRKHIAGANDYQAAAKGSLAT